MTITVHSVTDQLGEIVGNYNLGVNDEGYEKAMRWLDRHQEWRGGERFEYFGVDMEIQFKWDMDKNGFDRYMKCLSDPARYKFDNDYTGALFFGNMKLEFMITPDGTYHNLFHYGEEGYDWLEDGTPYDEELWADDFTDPRRRTFEGFAKNIEGQVTKWLNKYPIFIEDALEPTNPDKWYPGNKSNYKHEITREA